MKEAPANVLELPLLERALMALEAAVERVWEEHAREGLPIDVLHNGKIGEASPEELRIRLSNKK